MDRSYQVRVGNLDRRARRRVVANVPSQQTHVFGSRFIQRAGDSKERVKCGGMWARSAITPSLEWRSYTHPNNIRPLHFSIWRFCITDFNTRSTAHHPPPADPVGQERLL
ncbi:hypothetical protein V565_044720 [Rhizoctonia solani 123E]|uniref:Uncharacterized protein n=1 Tax=Rhizoctonia solani 123E TaxID=1423351 RepID=A0A074RZI9_9AGAM|nr:hypothetical protein V565_044720 [Rhizoctonia solani 123E]